MIDSEGDSGQTHNIGYAAVGGEGGFFGVNIIVVVLVGLHVFGGF